MTRFCLERLGLKQILVLCLSAFALLQREKSSKMSQTSLCDLELREIPGTRVSRAPKLQAEVSGEFRAGRMSETWLTRTCLSFEDRLLLKSV